MCSENEPMIRVYKFENDGMGGPVESSIEAIMFDVEEELKSWSHSEYGSNDSITLTITTGFMKQSEYDQLPEFDGY